MLLNLSLRGANVLALKFCVSTGTRTRQMISFACCFSLCFCFSQILLLVFHLVAHTCTNTRRTHRMSLVDVHNYEYCPDFRYFNSYTNLHYKIIARKWILCYCVYFDWLVRGLMYAFFYENNFFSNRHLHTS